MENTSPAFLSSLNHGFSALELDLVSLKDGCVVVYHDDDLKRFFQNPRAPGDLTLPEFRRIFRDLLTFDEFDEIFRDKKITVNFEIKDSTATLTKVEEKIRLFHHPVISSFHRKIVDFALENSMEAAYLFHSTTDLLNELSSLNCQRLHLNQEILLHAEEGLLEKLQQFSLFTYTVNDCGTLKRLMKISMLSGVFTDDRDLPACLLQ